MACNVEYFCRIDSIVTPTVCHHNVIINGEKWRKVENFGSGGSPSSKEDVIYEVTRVNCKMHLTQGFTRDWLEDCD